jgi:hypothetical protein
LPRADALAMTTFSAIAFVQSFEFIVKRTSILALAISAKNFLIRARGTEYFYRGKFGGCFSFTLVIIIKD